MPTVPAIFGLYGILTNPALGFSMLAEEMVSARLRFIQLRIKDAPPDRVLAIARELRRVIPQATDDDDGDGPWFIVNDDPRIARDSGADGVHLGQDDLHIAEARAIVGNDALIGLSSHNPEQTRSACALAPAYVGVGPVYSTPTKRIADPTIGIGGMQAMLAIAREAQVPAVVLGGIDETNIDDVVAGGGANICAVRYLNQAATREAVREAIATLKRAFEQ